MKEKEIIKEEKKDVVIIELDIDEVGSDYGIYDPASGFIKIYLQKIYHNWKKYNGTLEESILDTINDTINHESIHACIDHSYLEDQKLDDIDDHKIFKYLAPI